MSIKHFFLVLALLSGISASLMAQTLEGSILDATTQAPVTFATLYLFKQPVAEVGAKPFRTAFTDDNGAFRWHKLDTGAYLLKVSVVGYAAQQIEVVYTPETSQIPAIYLEPTTAALKEVTITANRPLLELKPDRLVYNVGSDPTNATATTLEILQKVPFLSVVNDKVRLKGKSNFKVLLNDRNTGLFALNPAEALQNYPPHLIARVEVITAPGARYDAEGIAGIINIVTLKKVAGYRGTVSSSVNTIGQQNNSATLDIKKGKVGWLLQASNDYNNAPNKSVYRRNNNVEGLALAQEMREGKGNDHTNQQSVFTELAWDIDSLTTISAHTSFNNQYMSAWMTEQHLGLDRNAITLEQGTFSDKTKYDESTWATGIDFFRKLKKEGHTIDVSVLDNRKFANSAMDNQRLFQTGYYNQYRLIIDSQPEKEKTVEANYSGTIKNSSISAGVKLIDRDINNTYGNDTLNFNTEVLLRIEDQSGIFNFHQRVWAAYGQHNRALGQYMLSLGLRYEYTQSDGQLNQENRFESNYQAWFPSVGLSRDYGTAGMFSLAFNKRLQRPGLYYLNPQISNLDPRNTQRGNPYLNPEYVHKLELSWVKSLKISQISAGVSHEYTTNVINAIAQINETTGITERNFTNLGVANQTTVSFFSRLKIHKKIFIFSNGDIGYVRARAEVNGISTVNSGLTGRFGSGLTYSGKGWNVSGIGLFMLPIYTLQTKIIVPPHYGFTFNKMFLKNKKLMVGLNASMPFQKWASSKSFLDTPAIQTEANHYTLGRTFRISATWRFGKLKENVEVSRKKELVNSDQKPIKK